MTDSEIPSHRACVHCRSQKVRCIVDDATPNQCQRCSRSGRPCVFTPLQKRKQRKRTDTRVAELEKEMRAMRSLLKKQQDGADEVSSPDLEISAEGPTDTSINKDSAEREPVEPQFIHYTEATSLPPLPQPHSRQAEPVFNSSQTELPAFGSPSRLMSDVISRGILTIETARQLFATYQSLFYHYPVVAVSETVTADEMRASKPTLFLAIIAAAAGKENSELSALLDHEILMVYATRSVINSEKSIELVQALLISTVWYHPPRKFGQLKYYEYTHMAMIMAMDIGIGSQPRKNRIRFKPTTPVADGVLRNAYQHPAEDAGNPDLSMVPRMKEAMIDTTSIESRRTFLALFVVGVGVSLSLRRPSMAQISTYLRECVDVVEKSPQALQTDRKVVAWAKLLMIGEEICTSFSYKDLGNVASLAELKTQFMLRDFQKRLDAWWANTPEAHISGALTIMYHTVRLNLHEVGMHVEHSPDDFKAPHQMGLIQVYDGPEIPTQVLAEAIAGCIIASHAICDAFLSMDLGRLRCLPVFSYVRLSYATFILVKLCLSAVHPSSRIAQVLDRDSLKVESYVDRMIIHARNIVGPTRCRIPAIFLALLFKLRQWCLHPEMIVQADQHSRRASSEESSSNSSHYGLEEGERQRTSGRDQPRTSSYNSSIPPHMDDSYMAAPAIPYTPSSNESNEHRAGSSMNHAGMNLPVNYSQPAQDQMELDKEFMDLWNEMNGFPAGGLTGLENWDQLPTDMTGTTFMSDMSTWPNMGAMM